jgi:hypothetical protein
MLTATLLLTGCNPSDWPSYPAGVAPTSIQLYAAGPGHVLGVAEFAQQVESSAVRGLTSPARNANLVHIPLLIEGANYQSPTDPRAPLYESRTHRAILTPNGRAVTLGLFNAPTGLATIRCVDHGTAVTLHLVGLIPNGVYTVWVLAFRNPGFEPTLSNLSAEGALGKPEGTRNKFTASARGEADITTFTHAGPLSMQGSIGDCALEDEFEFHVVGAYQLNGKSYGPNPGLDGAAVEQFGFVFKRQ